MLSASLTCRASAHYTTTTERWLAELNSVAEKLSQEPELRNQLEAAGSDFGQDGIPSGGVGDDFHNQLDLVLRGVEVSTHPAAAHLAMVPPMVNSESSGCAKMVMADLGI